MSDILKENCNLGIKVYCALYFSNANSGLKEASVVLNNVAAGEGNYGYNAATGEYGDMIAMGILDPAKVTLDRPTHFRLAQSFPKVVQMFRTDH